MSNTIQELYALKGIISELSEAEQATIRNIKEQLSILVDSSEGLGMVALGLLGLEIAIQEEANA